MSPEFQKIMDKLLHSIQNTFAFIHDILIVTKGSKEQHMEKVEVMKTLDEAGIGLKLKKCNVAQEQNRIVGVHINAEGNQTNWWKDTNNNQQNKTQKLERTLLIHGGNQSKE